MARYRGWVGGGGEWEARGNLNYPLGLFGLAMSPMKKSQPEAQTCLNGIIDVCLSLG